MTYSIYQFINVEIVSYEAQGVCEDVNNVGKWQMAYSWLRLV